jgi:STAS-like domain of unknown function (DUF4325)
MVIRIIDIVPGANTADQGAQVFRVLDKAMRGRGEVVVSFEGVQTATSSFVHSAFVELLNAFTYSDLKAKLRVINSTRQINNMIKARLEQSARVTA